MHYIKKYFILSILIVASNSLLPSQATGVKAATGAQGASASQVSAHVPSSAAGAAEGSAGAAAAFNKQELEYDVKVSSEHTTSTITKKTVLTYNPTGHRLEEIVVFSKKDYKNSPFEQIISSKIVGLRSLYPILTAYKEALMLKRTKEFTQLVAAKGSDANLSEFSYGASNGTFNFKNPQ